MPPLPASPTGAPADFRILLSANIDDRPPGLKIDCIVVHATAQPLDKTLEILRDPQRKVSSHYVVDRDGTIYEMVPPEKRAWHAGQSLFSGREKVNDFSIGIEIVNRNDGIDPFTDRQYASTARIIRLLRSAPYSYKIPDSRIVSHEAIARPKGRKNDPRGFDFGRLYRMLGSSPGP